MNGHLQNQLTKSLERILEEAHLSGELKLSGRKLKDFPKTGRKYDLSDTVIAGKITSFNNTLSLAPPNSLSNIFPYLDFETGNGILN
ncbi:UNVERIFIED_CONTAM: hypothetical protein PYX00_006602 [Menopon gallinae]|uniref:Uncharacterized protein n=1 Tax=Menopon gallinae TaxID=328185 RepID=A0AAW2HVL5_9NEOP